MNNLWGALSPNDYKGLCAKFVEHNQKSGAFRSFRKNWNSIFNWRQFQISGRDIQTNPFDSLYEIFVSQRDFFIMANIQIESLWLLIID